jgi:hypothetical protein
MGIVLRQGRPAKARLRGEDVLRPIASGAPTLSTQAAQ